MTRELLTHTLETLATRPKRSKFRNRKTVVDVITFDSAKESRRYGELKLLLRAGTISELRLQTRWPLKVEGVKVADYLSDFDYLEAGRVVVEDVKSAHTRKLRLYRLKAKIFAAQYGFAIREV